MTWRIRCGGMFWAAMSMAMLCGGCAVYVQQPDEAPPPGAAPVVETDTDTDTGYQAPPPDVISTYQTDLNPYGHWITDPTYGQCWEPNNCPPGWQPYTVGHWVDSDDGWTWCSDGDEVDWGPVVYHYGCWNQGSGGWCWVPGTTWAPAWVAWREGGGYCGWAPLPPQCAFSSNFSAAAINQYCPPNQFTYCNEQYMDAPRVDQHITRNNVTIINQTTNITNISYSNNRMVNPGVAVANVEHATGRSVQKVAITTVTSADEARKLVASGKPVMYAPATVTQAQSQRPAPRVANANPPQRQAQPENTPQRTQEPAQRTQEVPQPPQTPQVANRPANPQEPKQPAAPRPPEPAAQARNNPPPAGANESEARKTSPQADAPHETESSVEEKPREPQEQQRAQPQPAPQQRTEPKPQPQPAPQQRAEPKPQPQPQHPQEQNKPQETKAHEAPPQNNAQNKSPQEKGNASAEDQKHE
jgi:hypothetical protein